MTRYTSRRATIALFAVAALGILGLYPLLYVQHKHINAQFDRLNAEMAAVDIGFDRLDADMDLDATSEKFEQLQATTSAKTAELARLNDKIDALSETTNQILQHLLSSTQP